MSYSLGIDLGTTFTAAAVNDGSGVRVVSLAHDRTAIPSVVAPIEHGFLVGDEAAAVSSVTPWNVAREFKRRFGDSTPLIVDNKSHTADHLTGVLLEWVVRKVGELEGSSADRIVVTHPATWGHYKVGLLRTVTESLDLPPVEFLSEPAAAALNYHAAQRVEDGASIAVYDFGGGTFDVTLLERRDDLFAFRSAGGLDDVGGLDLDDAVFRLVVEAVAGHFEGLDTEDTTAQRAVARLREECTRAKVGLSYDSRVIVPVVLPGLVTEVLLQRSEFEARVEPLIDSTVEATKETMMRGGIDASKASILLVGGSSRLPLVAQSLAQALDGRIVVDTHPKHSVALGAAAFASFGGGRDMDGVAPTDVAAEVQELPTSTVILPVEVTTSVEHRQRFLTVLTGASGGRVLDLQTGSTVVGRSDGGGVWGIGGRLVSRRHLEFVRDGSAVKVWDLGSTNGTQVDGQTLGSAPVEIGPGTIVNVAGTLIMVDGPGAHLEPVSAIVDSWAMPLSPTQNVLKRRWRRPSGADWLGQLSERRETLGATATRLERARRFERPSAAVLGWWKSQLPGRVDKMLVAPGSVVLGWATLPSELRLGVPDFLRGADRERAIDIIGSAAVNTLVPLVVGLLGTTTLVQGPPSATLNMARSMVAELRLLSADLIVEATPDGAGGVAAIRVAYDPNATVLAGAPLATDGWVVFDSGSGVPAEGHRLISVTEDAATYRSEEIIVEFEPAALAAEHDLG